MHISALYSEQKILFISPRYFSNIFLIEKKAVFYTFVFLYTIYFLLFLVGYTDYAEYTDAYSRDEIEMMKNSGQNAFKQTQNQEKGNNDALRTNNLKMKKPTNWYLLYLSGKWVTGKQNLTGPNLFFIDNPGLISISIHGTELR